jgi:hypothetical protein
MNDSITILQTCASLAALWAFWQYGWKGYALDTFRQALFTVRGDLFEMAMRSENGLEFRSPHYITFRQFLNGRIRFAHRISFAQIAVGSAMSLIAGAGIRQTIEDYKTPVEIAIESLDNEPLKKKLRELENRASAALIIYLVMTSPIFLVMLVVSLIFAVICVLVERQVTKSIASVKALVKRKFISSVRSIDCQVEALDAKLSAEACPA